MDDIGTYEGPPCEFCRTSGFVGTCTHRKRRMPELPKNIGEPVNPPWTKEAAAIAVAEALEKVTLCARCNGDGFLLYTNSDGSGADRYECTCVTVKKALAEYQRMRDSAGCRPHER